MHFRYFNWRYSTTTILISTVKKKEQVSNRKELCQRGLIVTLMVGAVFNAVNKKEWRSEQHYFAGTLSQTLLAKYRFMTLPRISGVWNMISL